MNDDTASALRSIVERLEAVGIEYMIVGSIAGLAHGRTRATQDFDVVIEVDRARLSELLASLPPSRFYASEEAARDALARETLFNVIDMETGWKVDLIPLKRRSFSQAEFARRLPHTLFGLEVRVATIEDTIIAKLEWSKVGGGSKRQIEDVRELLRMATSLDRAYITGWITQLGLEAEWAEAQGA